MTENITIKPLIPWGWVRALIFALVYLLCFFLFSMLTGFLVTQMKPGGTNAAGTDLTNQVSGDDLWLTVIIGAVASFALVFVFRKWIDRKSLSSLGFGLSGHSGDALAGLFLAPALLGTGSLILLLTGHLQFTDVDFNGSSLFISFGIFVLIAFSEELVFRGYLLNNLMQSFNKWIALGISALLFTLFHLGAPGIGFIPLINIFLAGLLLGINYIYTKNLWFAILLHLSWNFSQGPLLGYKVSGSGFSSLLQTELKGDLALTGGDFGFEGSFFDTALTITVILCIYLVYQKKYTAQSVTP